LFICSRCKIKNNGTKREEVEKSDFLDTEVNRSGDGWNGVGKSDKE